MRASQAPGEMGFASEAKSRAEFITGVPLLPDSHVAQTDDLMTTARPSDPLAPPAEREPAMARPEKPELAPYFGVTLVI